MRIFLLSDRKHALFLGSSSFVPISSPSLQRRLVVGQSQKTGFLLRSHFLLFVSFAIWESVLSLTGIRSWAQTLPPPSVREDVAPMHFRSNPNPTPPIPEIRFPLERFFNRLVSGQIQQAFEELLGKSRLGQGTDNVKTLVEKVQQAMATYGKAKSFEVYDTYPVGTRIYVVSYLLGLELQPLRWRFVYYKPDVTWNIIDVRVDDEMEDLISR
ncbi:hypothetical protein [Candidatus Methylacidithermus pantelleriae]|uniref:Uncharacterized protein n=1 Tax=Candidatus Methylacidithermus pantelleriae TaxID=2744239 RepID=A0A8J2BJX6_9BACT|nr:hypothetical protein [Candidatus Methylacidithermus pantelleriae]CAF0691360.1 hypothetical protein MPNT_100020 [Candidatus Methylacidithermus pantelleriae]